MKSFGETPAQSVTVRPSLNVPIGTSTPAAFSQPGLVEAPAVEAGKPGGVELDPPARRRLGERRLAAGAGHAGGISRQGGVRTAAPARVLEPETINPEAT